MTPFVTPVGGPATERDIARDMVKKGLIAAPVLVAVCWAIWGTNGALSALYGVAIVCVNFLLSAALITLTARVSLGLMMVAVMFGYLARLALIGAAILLVRDASWVSLVALGLTIIVTHLGLLFWELRYVSITLAFPGLKPDAVSK
ncbi:MAG TPA: ATP synthase subunit I [Acidimicrobiales bacterium]|nr:ATP synthase subunit I [Acidimicrobiales bacterium]